MHMYVLMPTCEKLLLLHELHNLMTCYDNVQNTSASRQKKTSVQQHNYIQHSSVFLHFHDFESKLDKFLATSSTMVQLYNKFLQSLKNLHTFHNAATHNTANNGDRSPSSLWKHQP